MNQNDDRITTEENAAIDFLWESGDLTFLLDQNQLELYKIYKGTKEKTIVWNLARGLGKSTLLCVIASEECMKKPRTLVKYACSTKEQARQIVDQVMAEVFQTCPKKLKPEYKTNEHAFRFPNGSQIQLAGLDGGTAEGIRGGSAKLGIIDEAGQVKGTGKGNLKYIVRSIMIPAVTRNKKLNGKVILASTPPDEESHPFVTFMRQAEINKTLSVKTIYDCPRYTPEMIEQIIKEMGGVNSEDFRREYMCEIIRDSESAVIPEFTPELQLRIVREWERPKFYHRYVSLDVGARDFTAVLFGYWDFKEAKLIIEDEIQMGGLRKNIDNKKQAFNTKILADEIKFKESFLYSNPDTGEIIKAYKRVSDNNLILIQDLYQLHQLNFEPTRKDDKDSVLNNLKIMLNAEKIIINPRCVNLIRHLRDGRWDKNHKEFARDNVDNGHYDFIDALAYLNRNIETNVNPFPPGYGVPNGDGWYTYRTQSTIQNEWALKQMLNLNKRKR